MSSHNLQLQYSSEKSHRMNDFFGLLTLAFAASLFLSLITYDHNDPCWNVVGTNTVHNILGSFGAYLSDFFLQFFGVGAYVIVVIALFFSFIMLLRRRVTFHWFSLVGYVSMALVMAAFLHFWLGISERSGYSAGGAWGQWFALRLATQFGKTGAHLVLSALLLLSFLWTTQFSFFQFFLNILGKIFDILGDFWIALKGSFSSFSTFLRRRPAQQAFNSESQFALAEGMIAELPELELDPSWLDEEESSKNDEEQETLPPLSEVSSEELEQLEQLDSQKPSSSSSFSPSSRSRLSRLKNRSQRKRKRRALNADKNLPSINLTNVSIHGVASSSDTLPERRTSSSPSPDKHRMTVSFDSSSTALLAKNYDTRPQHHTLDQDFETDNSRSSETSALHAFQDEVLPSQELPFVAEDASSTSMTSEYSSLESKISEEMATSSSSSTEETSSFSREETTSSSREETSSSLQRVASYESFGAEESREEELPSTAEQDFAWELRSSLRAFHDSVPPEYPEDWQPDPSSFVQSAPSFNGDSLEDNGDSLEEPKSSDALRSVASFEVGADEVDYSGDTVEVAVDAIIQSYSQMQQQASSFSDDDEVSRDLKIASDVTPSLQSNRKTQQVDRLAHSSSRRTEISEGIIDLDEQRQTKIDDENPTEDEPAFQTQPDFSHPSRKTKISE